MSNNQQISEDSFREIIPKIMLALASAVVAPAVAFVVITLLIFGIVLVKSIAFDHQELVASEILDAINTAILFVIAFGMAALVIAAGHVAILGFPASIIGWSFGLIRWWSSTIVGFFLGCLPIALLMLPRKGSGSSVQGIPLEIDGVFTSAGWVNFAQLVLIMGFFGAVGGLAFWLVWRYWDRITRVKETNTIH